MCRCTFPCLVSLKYLFIHDTAIDIIHVLHDLRHIVKHQNNVAKPTKEGHHASCKIVKLLNNIYKWLY